MDSVILLGLLGVYATLLVLDAVAPARAFPKVRHWRLKGLASFVLFNALGFAMPFVWDELLHEHRLIDASGLGTALGGLVAVLVVQLVSYWWHRGMHRVPLLWRFFHQVHHSAERVDVYGAFYFSPLDMLGFLFVASFGMVFLVGVTPEAAMLANGVLTFASMFQHANLKTPRWVGYVLQRPENHAVHHERGVHAFNYGDIALWDIVFGTFKNPREWSGEGGFYDGASARLGDMLMGRDVAQSSPRAWRRDALGVGVYSPR